MAEARRHFRHRNDLKPLFSKNSLYPLLIHNCGAMATQRADPHPDVVIGSLMFHLSNAFLLNNRKQSNTDRREWYRYEAY